MKIHYSESRNDFETSSQSSLLIRRSSPTATAASRGRSCVRSSTATNDDIMSAYAPSATISKP